MTTENILPARSMPAPPTGVGPQTRPTPTISAPQAPPATSAPAAPAPPAAQAAPAAPAAAAPAGAATDHGGGLLHRLRGAVGVLYREMVKFGAIGALAFVVDLYVYNVLRIGIWPFAEAPLGHKTVLCKVISVSTATVVAWLGNRYWTFRHRRRATARSEFALFVVMNVGGLVIATACLWTSHYVLGLTSALADNVSSNGVGLVLGTLFRFWAYRQFVFTELKAQTRA